MKQKKLEFAVGIFMIVAIMAIIFMALQVSGLSLTSLGKKTYQVTAVFSDIGNLKVRAPVRVAGVSIGSVQNIILDKSTYEAKVILSLDDYANNLPTDTSARITSSGLLGDNYISLSPGYDSRFLKNGSKIVTTYPATSIQNLISTFVSGGKKAS